MKAALYLLLLHLRSSNEAPVSLPQVWFLLLNLLGLLLASISIWRDHMHRMAAVSVILMLTPTLFNDAQRLAVNRLLLGLWVTVAFSVGAVVAVATGSVPSMDYAARMYLSDVIPFFGYVGPSCGVY
jgi:hypothetical protein